MYTRSTVVPTTKLCKKCTIHFWWILVNNFSCSNSGFADKFSRQNRTWCPPPPYFFISVGKILVFSFSPSLTKLLAKNVGGFDVMKGGGGRSTVKIANLNSPLPHFWQLEQFRQFPWTDKGQMTKAMIIHHVCPPFLSGFYSLRTSNNMLIRCPENRRYRDMWELPAAKLYSYSITRVYIRQGLWRLVDGKQGGGKCTSCRCC